VNATWLPEAFIDVNHRADEVNTDLIGESSAEDVSPPPPAELSDSPFSSSSSRLIFWATPRQTPCIISSAALLKLFAAFDDKDLGNNQSKNAVFTSPKWWLCHCTTT